MAHRRRTNPLGTGQAAWPVFVLLLIAVVVPTACVLWFMTEAMGNERLAVRQRLAVAYQSQLAVLRNQLEAIWTQRVGELAKADADTEPAERFASVVKKGLCDSAIIYDRSGQVVYPTAAPIREDNEARDSAEWAGARRIEHDRGDFQAAADAYAAIARLAADADMAAAAIQAQARCLGKAGQTEAAIGVLVELARDTRFRAATDARGRLIVPDICLRALELMGGPEHRDYRAMRDLLAQRLTDYGQPVMPSSQRRFLMHEAQRIVPDGPGWPTLAAEDLAATYVEAGEQLAARRPLPHGLSLGVLSASAPGDEAGYLRPSRLPEVWELRVGGGALTALFKQKRVIAQAAPFAQICVPSDEVHVALVPPGAGPREEPFLVVGAGDRLPGWRWGLWLRGAELWSQQADQRIAVYLWTGVLVTVVIAVLTGLVARYIGRQMRLTRLKNDLIATVSHELKTPLASMRALVDTLIERRYRDEGQVQEYLRLIAKENTRLSRLIDNFLTFSRMERNKRAFEFAEVRVDQIVTAAVEAMRERFEAARGHLEVELPDALPTIHGDHDALVTVLLNLLDNAYKYSEDDRYVVVRAYAADGNVCLEVQDHGIGLSRRAMKRVFDRFYQADQSLSRRTGGCGLGLSIVRFIVDAHGGTVGVDSELGKGSTFTVRLPMMSDE